MCVNNKLVLLISLTLNVVLLHSFWQIKIKHENNRWCLYRNEESHSIEEVTTVYGIAPMYAEEISEGLKFGKKAKLLRSHLVTKYGNRSDMPTLQQIRTRRVNLVNEKESKMGMKYLTDVTNFVDEHIVTSKEAFLKKGVYFCCNANSSIVVDNTIFSFFLLGASELVILGRHSTAWHDEVTQEEKRSEGFVYSCRDLLDNMQKQVVGCGDNIAISTDTTFNLFCNGWCMYSCGCRSLYRERSGKITQQYRPFCFLLSRTERGDGYAEMFSCLSTVREWQGLETYVVKATCSDHHDGLIKAVIENYPNGELYVY